MFWYRFVTKLVWVITFGVFYSCREKTINPIPASIDIAKIKYWRDTYDSLYDKYSPGKDSFLIQAGPFADSMLLNEKQLLKDSNTQKIFFNIIYNRGLDLNDLHFFIKSRELLDRYITLYHQYQFNNPVNLAYAQKTLGDIYSRYGDYKKAILLIGEALKYYTAAKKREEKASCLLNLAIPQKELHHYDEAEQTLQKIFQLDSLGPERKGKACIELADIYTRQNKINEAAVELKRAKEFIAITPYKPIDQERAGTYSDIFSVEGDWLMAGAKPVQALAAYRRSLDSAIAGSSQDLRDREIGKIYIAMGKAYRFLHLPDSTLNCYSRALYTVTDIDMADKFSLPAPKDIYAENTIAEALYARADCIIGRGTGNQQELENAVNCYKLAFATERKLLDAFTYDESRQFMVEETRKEIEKAIAVCWRLYQLTNNSRWAKEAFLFAEHNKAFVLAESVRRNIAASIFLQHDTVYERLQALRSKLSSTEMELARKKFAADPDTGLIRALISTKQKTEEELLSAENDLRIKNPQYNDWMSREDSLTAEEIINKTIPAGSTVIEYFTGDSSVYVFTGEPNRPLRFYKLTDTVKGLTADLLNFFSNRNMILADPVGYATAAYKLYQLILGPYLPAGNKKLLVIPDGFICYIPFDALLTNSTISTSIASFPFLIKQQESYYAFSCRTLLAQAQYKNTTGGNGVIAFAPVFQNKERNMAPLLHSAEELEAIKTSYPGGKFYTGTEATEKQFEKEVGNVAVLHLATHANSGNDSSRAGIEFYDSTLYLDNIYAMPLNAKLVVLSGCETGRGNINKTEGLMSLARGFSYAGTKNVIASLWPTEDNNSATIFKNFYSNLATDNFSSSLHKAKLSLINDANISSASPYYWSGFIYIGSPSENINASSTGRLKWTAGLAGLILIIGWFFLKRKRSTR